MTIGTMATKDAERLVAEGGVVNLDHGQPYWCPTQRRWLQPGTSHSCLPETKHWPRDIIQVGEAGEVYVTDVHHAETCARRVGRVIEDVAYCHPDAKGGRWHWTVEPAEAS